MTLKHFLFYVACFISSFIGQSQTLSTNIDQLIQKSFNANEPGVSVLVAKDGKTIYKKGVGLANLELNEPITPNHIFEIGSITKQFTAVAILMLEEEGKLSVNDTITKFIPDYPTQGKTITIHHLLNHTSGIKNYTSMPVLKRFSKADLTPKQLINIFKNEPLNFNPGEKYAYCNSGYVLLGYIIEIVSGESYKDFIKTHIFDKLKMDSSLYGDRAITLKNRATGYRKSGKKYIPVDFISMNLPYAAGAIMSTTEDLLKWQNALANNTLISKTSFIKASNGSNLNNGKHIAYGYGLQRKKINGSDCIQHGGSIFGYKSMGIYLPDENIFVSTLSNGKSPTLLAKKIAALAIEKPFPEIEDSITIKNDLLQKWIGVYQFKDSSVVYITAENDKLFSHGKKKTKKRLFPLTPTKFIHKNGFPSFEFSINNTKQLSITNDFGSKIAYKIDAPIPEKNTEGIPSRTILNKYVGKYELKPDFIITITTEGDKIYAQATGQAKLELFANSHTHFYLKVVKATIDFNLNEKGEVISLTLHQNGNDREGKKIK